MKLKLQPRKFKSATDFLNHVDDVIQKTIIRSDKRLALEISQGFAEAISALDCPQSVEEKVSKFLDDYVVPDKNGSVSSIMLKFFYLSSQENNMKEPVMRMTWFDWWIVLTKILVFRKGCSFTFVRCPQEIESDFDLDISFGQVQLSDKAISIMENHKDCFSLMAISDSLDAKSESTLQTLTFDEYKGIDNHDN
ncbi:MAG: hypothetical protein LBS23_00135 [Holosporaceae bacterium]|jgi:hypothetical protein|nr:hypothetical protein [Holosporaceae bacterium]